MRVECVQYHCCFLLNPPLGSLSMGIAWRRIGKYDYGVYLTRRVKDSDQSPNCTVFRASYSPRGELQSFLVSDSWVKPGMFWDDDHVNPSKSGIVVSVADMEQLRDLANIFFLDWIESFGSSDAEILLKQLIGGGKLAQEDVVNGVLFSGLPAEIKKNKLPDVLSCAEMTEQGFLYSFLPFPERFDSDPQIVKLLESKMEMFFELL